jgi:cell division protein WhiA
VVIESAAPKRRTAVRVHPRATALVRDELVRVRAQRPCDRRAELAGLVRSAGTLHLLGGGRYALGATTEHPGVARRLVQTLRTALDAPAELRLIEPGRGHPRQRYLVRCEDVSLQQLVEGGIVDESGAPGGAVPRRIVAKRCCAGAFIRGTFLARGSVSDPRHAPAHLELRSSTEAAAHSLVSVFAVLGLHAKVRAHRGYATYLKTVASIGTALAAMGAHDAYLAWEEGTIWKSVHVEAGRLANADAANAKRLARAAVSQIAAIEELDQSRGLASLPTALREAAELRRANPTSSLDELAQLCAPAITKAAFADRLRRIARLAGFETGQAAG